MVSRILLPALLLGCVCIHALAADPAAGWNGVKVLPKVDAEVRVGNETIHDFAHPTIKCPWIVQEVNGDRLLVGDHRKGWVQRSQVITLDEAPAYYTELIKDNKDRTWAYFLRAIAWREKGDLDLAIADLGEYLRLRPDVVGYNGRAFIWLKKKDYEKAFLDADQAIRLDSEMAVSFLQRGKAQKGKKSYEKAMTDFNEAIRLDPKYPEAFNSAAWLRATCPEEHFRNGKKAVELATNACELSGWTIAAELNTLGAAYAETGDFDSAIKYQNKAIDLNPKDAEFVKEAKERLALYKDHKPYRDE